MAERVLLGFALALLVCVALTPSARRVALSTGIVDRPATRKVHAREMPYLGGLAIAVAALVGIVVAAGSGWRAGVVALAAVALGLVGLLDDERTLGPMPRVAVQCGAAAAAALVGIRAEPFGAAVPDLVLTLGWLVLVTNAFNLLDNMDGLAAGVATSASFAVLALAAAGDQSVVAVFAAAIAGACCGFLAFNWKPATIFMGDAGALFLGYVLAVASLSINPEIAPPGSFVVPVLLLAVPLLDTTTVVVARSRHGISVMQGGRDHLSHRLVARGLRQAAAVAILVAAESVAAGLALFVGRGVLHPAIAVGLAVATLGPLVWVCSRAEVYAVPVVGWSTRVRRAVALAAAAVAAVAVPALVASTFAVLDALEARRALERAELALSGGDTEAARRAFGDAAGAFSDADNALHGPLVAAGRMLPVVGPHVDALRALVASGATLSRAGLALTESVDLDRLTVEAGTVPVADVRRAAPHLRRAHDVLERTARVVRRIDTTYLFPQLANVVDDLSDRLDVNRNSAYLAAEAADVVPAIFGEGGTRRYFLAVQNSAELRATGGFIGNWGILTATSGKLRLDEFERIAVLNTGGERVVHAPEEFVRRYGRFDLGRTWQNVNMSPDLPTVGRVIADLLPQSGRAAVDGVIAVDPVGLASLLELTGPVEVTGWPGPIDAENVVDVTLRDAYERFERGQREEFLGDVARSVWDAVTRADLGRPDVVAGVLHDAVAGRHLSAWLSEPAEQDLLEDLDAAGAVPPVQADSFMVVNQNAAGNKADYYLRRSVRYDVRLTPRNGRAGVDATLAVELRNDAPEAGLPQVVIGPFDARFLPGENRSFTTVYTPLVFDGATLDGHPVALESAPELDRHAYSTFVSIPARSSRRLELTLRGDVPLADGWYRLDLPRQAVLSPDDLRVRVTVADGWRVTATRGARQDRARSVVASGPHDRDRTLWVRVQRARGWWSRLLGRD